jgi:hypothetical protein
VGTNVKRDYKKVFVQFESGTLKKVRFNRGEDNMRDLLETAEEEAELYNILSLASPLLQKIACLISYKTTK